MNKETLEEGIKLKNAAHAWWRKTIPSFEHPNYQDEPIPQFMKWFDAYAVPELMMAEDWSEVARKELAAINLRERGSQARRERARRERGSRARRKK